MTNTEQQFETILNLARFHREHEKYYSRSPLENAVRMQNASGVLKTLADRWAKVEVSPHPRENPYMGCEDLNEVASIQYTGILFLEGEEAPTEIDRLKRDIEGIADDYEQTSSWLSQAMETSWAIASGLIEYPALAYVIGERHRIIANDWQAASQAMLVSRLLRRSLDILNKIDFSPGAVRDDIQGPGTYPGYLFSSSELIDRAADIAAASAVIVHDNERRWRVFYETVQQLVSSKEVLQPK